MAGFNIGLDFTSVFFCLFFLAAVKVPEFDEFQQENQLFRRLSLYLNTLESWRLDSHLFAGPTNPTTNAFSLNPNQSLDDEFLNARVRWTYQVGEERAFMLRIRKRDKRRILQPYFQHIYEVCDEIHQSPTREVRLFTNAGGGGEWLWRSVPFTHPATIDTIAMDADVKTKVKADLKFFLKAKQYYHRLGRAWRRSYLLYGQSGTGKSSFVAAMSKFLAFDIYYVDLSKVSCDSDLFNLLHHTTNRSVILLEDFDRFIAAAGKSNKVSIPGLLNFMDGAVNPCCDERVMVFTMRDRIDPALLRPGCVDVHIHFPMCDFNNFKNLAANYLGVTDHKLFPMVEEMFQSGATLSPAEIGELMMVNRRSRSRALKSVITALQTTGGDRRSAANINAGWRGVATPSVSSGAGLRALRYCECVGKSPATKDKEEEEDEEQLSLTALRKMAKAERSRADAALSDLENVQMVAASAAEESMAMILRLQNEKSALQLEVKHTQRLAESRQAYDREVIESLERSLMRYMEERSVPDAV